MQKVEYDMPSGNKISVFYDNFGRALVSREILENLIELAAEVKRMKGENNGI